MKQTFLIIYRLGPAWLVGQPHTAQPLQAHGQFLLKLYQQGQLHQAGPFGDHTGGALVMEVEHARQARVLIETDPAVVNGLFTYELHPWTLLPWDQYLARLTNSS